MLANALALCASLSVGTGDFLADSQARRPSLRAQAAGYLMCQSASMAASTAVASRFSPAMSKWTPSLCRQCGS